MHGRLPNRDHMLLNTLLTIITLIISMIALIVAMRSCQYSQDQLLVSQRQFDSSLKLVWDIVPEKEFHYKLVTITPGVVIYEVWLHVPTILLEMPHLVRGISHNRFSLNDEIMQFEKKVKFDGRVSSRGGHSYRPKWIPIVIEADYVINGIRAKQFSLYLAMPNCDVAYATELLKSDSHDQNNAAAADAVVQFDVKVVSLSPFQFIRHITDSNIQEVLDEEWSNRNGRK